MKLFRNIKVSTKVEKIDFTLYHALKPSQILSNFAQRIVWYWRGGEGGLPIGYVSAD